MTVNQTPQHRSCISLDLRVLIVRRQEREETWQELVVLGEVNLVDSVLKCCVSEEQKNMRHEVLNWSKFSRCRDVDCV